MSLNKGSVPILGWSDYTLKSEKGAYWVKNDPKRSAVPSKAREEILRSKRPEYRESLSEASKMKRSTLSRHSSTIYISSIHDRNQNGSNFITLGKISEQEKIEIIQTGFQLQNALKKYYESADPYSLFQLKGYSIKYENIRRTKLYKILNQQFKPS